MNYWERVFHVAMTILVIAALGGLVLLGFMAYNAYDRGEAYRKATNDTKIERERITQDALRSYRESR